MRAAMEGHVTTTPTPALNTALLTRFPGGFPEPFSSIVDTPLLDSLHITPLMNHTEEYLLIATRTVAYGMPPSSHLIIPPSHHTSLSSLIITHTLS